MPTINYRQPNQDERKVEVTAGKRVMQSAIAASVDGIVAECGGQAMCATCHVYVDDPWLADLPPIEDEEHEMLAETTSPRTERSRLSCQIIVNDDLDGLTVEIPPTQV